MWTVVVSRVEKVDEEVGMNGEGGMEVCRRVSELEVYQISEVAKMQCEMREWCGKEKQLRGKKDLLIKGGKEKEGVTW